MWGLILSGFSLSGVMWGLILNEFPLSGVIWGVSFGLMFI